MSEANRKRCSGCGHTKPLSDFSPNKGGRLGRNSRCRTCCNRAMAGRRKKQRERLRRPDDNGEVQRLIYGPWRVSNG